MPPTNVLVLQFKRERNTVTTMVSTDAVTFLRIEEVLSCSVEPHSHAAATLGDAVGQGRPRLAVHDPRVARARVLGMGDVVQWRRGATADRTPSPTAKDRRFHRSRTSANSSRDREAIGSTYRFRKSANGKHPDPRPLANRSQRLRHSLRPTGPRLVARTASRKEAATVKDSRLTPQSPRAVFRGRGCRRIQAAVLQVRPPGSTINRNRSPIG